MVARDVGSDAAGLAYDAVARAKAEGIDVVLIDTAGRLQNKEGLMDELENMERSANPESRMFRDPAGPRTRNPKPETRNP